ncbi:MAG: chorismate--pyruvate lyase family protein [Gammaproteobacteria bacterium]
MKSKSGAPDKLIPWLFDEGSLTRRLQTRCIGPFSVILLHQQWGMPMHNERLVLGMAERTTGLIRHVMLKCGNTPCVFARTVVPARTLQGRQRRLSQLGERPLGAMLFADKRVTRGGLQIAMLDKKHGLFKIATETLARTPREIWGRRSVFYFGEKPLLVNEIFLPGINNKCTPIGR